MHSLVPVCHGTWSQNMSSRTQDSTHPKFLGIITLRREWECRALILFMFESTYFQSNFITKGLLLMHRFSLFQSESQTLKDQCLGSGNLAGELVALLLDPSGSQLVQNYGEYRHSQSKVKIQWNARVTV